MYDKTKFAIPIRNLQQSLNHRLVLKKVHRVIQFNQKSLPKPDIDMNTELRQKTKNNSEKDFFKLMNNIVFGKTMENVRNYRNTKLVIKERRRSYLVSQPNYHTIKFFTENFLAIEMRKTQMLINKPDYRNCLKTAQIENEINYLE